MGGTRKLDMPVYHVHFLTRSLIDEYEAKRRMFLGTEKQGRLEHIWLYEYLCQQIDEQALSAGDRGSVSSHSRWKVVTLTRETVGRNVSNFFELVEVEPLEETSAGRPPSTGCRYRVRSDPDFYDLDIVVDTRDLSELLQVFIDKPNHDEPLTFFEQEIKGVLGLDGVATLAHDLQGAAHQLERAGEPVAITARDLEAPAAGAAVLGLFRIGIKPGRMVALRETVL